MFYENSIHVQLQENKTAKGTVKSFRIYYHPCPLYTMSLTLLLRDKLGLQQQGIWWNSK